MFVTRTTRCDQTKLFSIDLKGSSFQRKNNIARCNHVLVVAEIFVSRTLYNDEEVQVSA